MNLPTTRTFVTVVLIVTALVAIGAGAFFFQSGRDTTGETAKKPTDLTPSLATEKYGFSYGEPTAPVKVVVYEDFICPACLGFEQENWQQLEKYVAAGDVQVEYRIMSFLDQQSTTAYSSRAMNAYIAVQENADPAMAQVFRMHLFANQPAEGGPGLTDEQILSFAGTAGIQPEDMAPIESAQAELSYQQWIVDAADQASKDGVNSTPSVFVNDELLEDPFKGFTAAVDAALAPAAS